MNGTGALNIARQQLCNAISQYRPPPCTPLSVSPWLGMSLLQKSIRRGDGALALRAAVTLLQKSPERLWRRCC